MWRKAKHCRWCGKPYYANKPDDRDGFDSAKCKMAFHRAYKRYVTHLALQTNVVSNAKKRKGKKII